MAKRFHAYKDYARTYNNKFYFCLNSELQLKVFKKIHFRVFKKIESDDKTKYSSFYWPSKAETIINETDIDDVFQPIYITIISNIQKLPRELDYPKNCLINIQNIDNNEYFN